MGSDMYCDYNLFDDYYTAISAYSYVPWSMIGGFASSRFGDSDLG